jgi:hypothetical protein
MRWMTENTLLKALVLQEDFNGEKNIHFFE